MYSAKKWSICFLIVSLLLMIAIGGATVIVDPYFHYHEPLEQLQYPIYRERYQNDGIVKNFDYDAIITGTSMTESFHASEMNELFGVNAVKVPFSGSTFKEVDNNLRRAIEANPRLTMVLRCLDGYMLYAEKDKMRTDVKFPEYLYDYKLMNDVEYLLNKSIFLEDTLEVLWYTKAGNQTTSFDKYVNWNDAYAFGAESVFAYSEWALGMKNNTDVKIGITEEMEFNVRENMKQNVIAVVEENPQIEFYFYFPPYSIIWWGNVYNVGTIRSQIDSYRIASEMLLEYDNVHLFSFSDDYSVTLDLNNYRDLEHHSAEINSKILDDIHQGKRELTAENYQEHWDAVFEYYNSFDYESYLKQYMYLVNGTQ